MKIQEDYKYGFAKYFLFGRLIPKLRGKIYHGIGTQTGEQIDQTFGGSTSVKKPTEYAESVVKRIDHGILPTASDRNYNSCSILPAVYFYVRLGHWGVAYFELDSNQYPVFINTVNELNAGGQLYSAVPSEAMIYSHGPLPLRNYRLVFSEPKGPLTTLLGTKEPDEYIREVIRNLPDKTPRGNKVIICVNGKQCKPSEY